MRTFGRSTAALAAMVACVAVGVMPGPSVAAARTSLVRQLTLTGDKTGWVAVDLPRAIAAECPGTPGCAAKAAFKVSGGAFGYFLIYENDTATRPVPSLVVVKLPKAEGGHVVAMAGGTDPRTGASIADSAVLPAGRYRLFLLTKGRGTVSVRFPELKAAAVTVRPTRSTDYRAVESAPTYAGPLAPSAWAGGITIPATGVRSHGYVFDWTHGPAAAGVVGALCLYRGDPPAGTWVPGCPAGESLVASQTTPATECCGTAYGGVVGAGDRFSFGSYYVQNGPVTAAGRFIVWVPDR